MMMTTRLALATVMVLVTLSCCCAKELSPDKLKKSFLKINKYLEKNEPSDDVATNLAKAMELLKDKSSARFKFLGGSSLIEALELLGEYSEVPVDESHCNAAYRSKLIAEIDAGLDLDKSRSLDPNYPLTRVDRLIEHLAYEDARHCGYLVYFQPLSYGYKQLAYDIVNSRLVEALPQTEDVDLNMAKAQELFDNLKQTKDGALTDALRLFLSLKQTLNEDTCNEKGFEILYKNDLATKRSAHQGYYKPLRRVDKIFQHYLKGHEKLCRSIVLKDSESQLIKLKQNIYQHVLAIVGIQFLDTEKYNQLFKEIVSKPVDEEFHVPLLAERLSRKLKRMSGSDLFKFSYINSMSPDQLYYYVLAASTSARNVIGRNKSDSSKQYVDKEMMKRYLFEPCSKFFEVFGHKLESSEYSLNMNLEELSNNSSKDKTFQNINFHTIRAGYYACKHINSNQDYISDSIAMFSRTI